LGQYDAALSWAREELYLTPNHLQALAVRTAALAQLGRTEEAKNAAEVLLSNYPNLTVDRMMRHMHWKLPEDVAHYREGLIKAGIPLGKVEVIESSPKLAADS
jgi:adenylate cyclase